MSDPILDLLAAPPAPSMTVDEDAIRNGGLRRIRRRQIIRASGTGLAVATAVSVLWIGLPHAATDLAPAANTVQPAKSDWALDLKVTAITSSDTAVPLKLTDGTRVWIDAGKLSEKGHMLLAARSAAGMPLGAGSKATEPVGRPYHVPIDWSRTLLPDRLLVWGVGLEGTTNFQPDLTSGAKVVSTTTALIPGSHIIVYVLDVRSPGGAAPSSIDVVSGLVSQSPGTWPPQG